MGDSLMEEIKKERLQILIEDEGESNEEIER